MVTLSMMEGGKLPLCLGHSKVGVWPSFRMMRPALAGKARMYFPLELVEDIPYSKGCIVEISTNTGVSGNVEHAFFQAIDLIAKSWMPPFRVRYQL